MNSLVSSEPNATSKNNINAALLATYDYGCATMLSPGPQMLVMLRKTAD